MIDNLQNQTPHHDMNSPASTSPSCRTLPRRLGVASRSFLLSVFCVSAWGQYSITWSTLDGGGGTSTNGPYALTGTIGQPDAGLMSAGNYTLEGGFWNTVAAVQTPGAPTLLVRRTETNTVTVSWPLPEAGWKLHATTNLSATPISWTELAPPYATNSTSLHFIEPAPLGNKFYRLHKP